MITKCQYLRRSSLNSNHPTSTFAARVVDDETVPSFGGIMGQVFYSELAGHLFAARGTDGPDRISDIYFAEERRQKLGNPKDCVITLPDSSVDPRLPTFSHDEIITAIETLRSQGIILLVVDVSGS